MNSALDRSGKRSLSPFKASRLLFKVGKRWHPIRRPWVLLAGPGHLRAKKVFERPAGHLTFSGGIHRCLGMWLARAEMQEALTVLSGRFARVEPDGEPTWQPGLGIDGPTTLPLRFVAG